MKTPEEIRNDLFQERMGIKYPVGFRTNFWDGVLIGIKKTLSESSRTESEKTNFLQIVDQTHEEKLEMYLKLPAKQVAEMLIECNKIIDGRKPTIVFPLPSLDEITENHKIDLCNILRTSNEKYFIQSLQGKCEYSVTGLRALKAIQFLSQFYQMPSFYPEAQIQGKEKLFPYKDFSDEEIRSWTASKDRLLKGQGTQHEHGFYEGAKTYRKKMNEHIAQFNDQKGKQNG